MSVILFLILLSIVIAAGFLVAFVWAVRSGQYEDTDTPPLRVLLDEPRPSGGRRPFPSTHNPKIEHEH